ncbi:MAG: Cyanase [Cyanobacteriota bacterium]|jgi:cyanate lyase
MAQASTMAQASVTATLLAAKRRTGLSFADLGARLGVDEVWIASLIHGQATASAEEAQTLVAALELEGSATADELLAQLTTYPIKGALDPVIPTDPLLYRFYEILQVYGLPLKDVIQEKCGDGIMSAIDFTLTVDKVEDPRGDRVVVTMNGKFLPYRKW